MRRNRCPGRSCLGREETGTAMRRAHARDPEVSRDCGQGSLRQFPAALPGFAGPPWNMDPFLVLLHSVSRRLSSGELSDLKFLCRERVTKRKLERVQSSLDLFSVLLEQGDLERERPGLLRELLASLRRHDLLRLLDDFEAGAAAGAAPGEADLRVAFDIVCDNVGRDWKRLARQLKLSEAKMDGIEERYPRSLSERVREVLRVWKSADQEKATVARLLGALRACQLNLVADLVEEAQQAQGSAAENGDVSMMLWESAVSSEGP